MLIRKDDHHNLLNLLGNKEILNVTVGESNVLIHYLENISKLSMSTVVYDGGNYIPSSVRRCLSIKSPFSQELLRTFLTVDEQNFRINLNYVDKLEENFSYPNFKYLLEEFGILADKWRDYLNENDKNDLVYVRVK